MRSASLVLSLIHSTSSSGVRRSGRVMISESSACSTLRLCSSEEELFGWHIAQVAELELTWAGAGRLPADFTDQLMERHFQGA